MKDFYRAFRRNHKLNIKGPNLAKSRLWKNVFIKPMNKEQVNHDNYLREVTKIDSFHKEKLPSSIKKIVEDSLKVPLPPTFSKPKAKKPRTYSPGRYSMAQTSNRSYFN